jgi:scyllo-inositol 2-dehydrogenase (NADP+)
VPALATLTTGPPIPLMTRDLNIGLVGYGLAGAAFHAPIIDAVSGLRLAAVVTSNPERAAAATRGRDGVTVLPDVDSLWRRATELDAVVIASPNRTHVELALAALEAGLHVVVDKPLAGTATDAVRLCDAADRAGRVLTVYQNRRWDGDFLTLRRLLHDDALGDVIRFESRFEKWRPHPKPGWRESADPQDAGGVLYDLGSHLVDQALALFGPARTIYAELDCRRPGARVDDDAFVALTHQSGVRSHLWMSALAGQPGPRMRVLGTRATWTKRGLDPQEAALRAGETPGGAGWGEEPASAWGVLGAGDNTRPIPTEPGDYRRFYAALADAIRHGTPPPVDPRDAVASLRVLEAARRSAHDHAPQGITLDPQMPDL